MTLTTCLPFANAPRQWSTAAIGCPGALHDHVDGRVAHQRFPVVTDVGGAVAHGGIQAGRLDALRLPADAGQVALRGGGREIGDADQLHAGRARDLGQVHGAELAGADQADADRLAVGGALLELGGAGWTSSWGRASSAGVRA